MSEKSPLPYINTNHDGLSPDQRSGTPLQPAGPVKRLPPGNPSILDPPANRRRSGGEGNPPRLWRIATETGVERVRVQAASFESIPLNHMKARSTERKSITGQGRSGKGAGAASAGNPLHLPMTTAIRRVPGR